MYTGLRKLSNIFFVIAAVFFLMAFIVLGRMQLTSVDFQEHLVATVSMILYVFAIPGLFAGIGIALRKINREFFDQKLFMISN